MTWQWVVVTCVFIVSTDFLITSLWSNYVHKHVEDLKRQTEEHHYELALKKMASASAPPQPPARRIHPSNNELANRTDADLL